jgi:hypothetical protein
MVHWWVFVNVVMNICVSQKAGGGGVNFSERFIKM